MQEHAVEQEAAQQCSQHLQVFLQLCKHLTGVKRLAKYPVKFLLSKLKSAPSIDINSIAKKGKKLKDFLMYRLLQYREYVT